MATIRAAEAEVGGVYRTPRGLTVVYRGRGEDLERQVPGRHRLERLDTGEVVLCGPGQVLLPARDPSPVSEEFCLEW